MSEEYRRLREAYNRERRAAWAVTGGRRRSPTYTGFTAEELQMIDSSMKRYQLEEEARREAAAHSVRGRIKSLWESITHE
jgi:hypothetical protein